MPKEQWVVAVTVSGELQAEILRGLLVAQGIPVQLSQEGAARVYGLSVGPMSDVDILVPSNQEINAQAVLESYTAGDFEQSDDE